MSDEKKIDKTKAFEIAAECLKPITDAEPFELITNSRCPGIYPKQHIRDTIATFAEAMDKKLRRDDDRKSAWETESAYFLRESLWDEMCELHEAFDKHEKTTDDPDGKALMEECCDVANFAMMIFFQLHPLTRHNRHGSSGHIVPRA
ncbi:MAG: hypothetical protein WA151_11945 [Desulfatirhabdiaceae bacterium]